MKHLVLLIVIILLTGCRTSSGSYSKKNDISAVTREQLSLQSLRTDKIITQILSNYNASLTGTIRHYAPPDSTGSPILVSESDFKLQINGSSQEDSITESSQEDNVLEDHESNLIDQTEVHAEQKTDSRMIRLPDWMTGLLAFAWVIFLILLFRKYKKVFL